MSVILSRRFRWSRFIRMLEMPFMFYALATATATYGNQLDDGAPKWLLHGNLRFLFRGGFLRRLLREDEFLRSST